jgi:hypothetical protein
LNTRTILNAYRDTAVWIWCTLLFPPSIWVLFVLMDKEWSLQKKGG